MTTVALSIVAVKSVEECGVDESTRPDHARGPHNELSEDSSKGEPKNLSSKADQEFICNAGFFTVEVPLSHNDIGGISTADDDVGHNRDADMLLNGEGSRVESPPVPKSVEHSFGENYFKAPTERQGDKLGDNASNINGWI